MLSKLKKRKSIKFRSLVFSLAIAFLTMSILIILVSNGFDHYLAFQNQKIAIADKMQLIVQDAATTVRNFIADKYDIMKAAVHFSNLATISGNDQQIIMRKIIGFEQGFSQLILLDTQNRELVRVSLRTNSMSNQVTEQIRDEIVSQIRIGKAYISSVFLDKTSFEPMVFMAIPVTDVFDDYQGILIAEVKLKFLWDLIEKLEIGDSGLVYVVDMHGILIAYNDIDRVLKGENVSHLSEVRDFVNHKNYKIKKATIAKGINGEEMVATHISLGMPDWAVVIELPVSEAYETITQGFITTSIVLFFSSILVVFAGFFISKRITKPIIQLRDAVRIIGKGNLDTKIKVTAKNEIGELALSFNQMVKDLKTTTVSRDYLIKEVDEREKVEKRLRKTEEKYRTLFERTIDAIFVADAETGIILDCNPAAENLVEWNKTELIGQHQSILHPRDMLKGEFTIGFKGVSKNIDSVSKDVKAITKNGEIKDVAIKATIFEIHGKKVVQGIFRDITNQKRAEMKLKIYVNEIEEINKELDDFTYIVSHDLKEPLRSIDAFSKFLEDDYNRVLDKNGKNYLTRIRINSRRMQKLIEDLLEVSRLGRRENPFERMKIGNIVRDIQLRLEHLIAEKKAKLVIQENLPSLFCDRVRLTEVFANLLSNALKFNDKSHPIIEIGCTEKGSVYEFYVKDNGPGIQEQYFNKIFEIFQRLGRKDDKSGTGAGLTISRKIIHMHNGKIWVESELGKGTTFYFTLPKKSLHNKEE